MKRTTNFSKKKVIKPSSLNVSLTKHENSYILNTEITDLPRLDNEDEVALRLRVRADSKVWRIYYLGTVDNIENLENEEFPDVEEGRTKKVECILNLIRESGSREILAYSKNITIQKFRYEEDEEIGGESENVIPLVTVDYDREGSLGNVPWNLEISDDTDTYPKLVLHHDFIEVELKQKIFTGSGVAQTLILVQIIRDVLKYLLVDETCNINEPDSEDGWKRIWLLWAKEMATETYYENEQPDIKSKWIEDLLNDYCRRNKLIKHMKNELSRF